MYGLGEVISLDRDLDSSKTAGDRPQSTYDKEHRIR